MSAILTIDRELMIENVVSSWRDVRSNEVRNGDDRRDLLVGRYQGVRDLAIAMSVRWSELDHRLDEVDAEYLLKGAR